MLKIRIEQQYAQIGLHIQEPRIQLHSTPPTLEMAAEKPQLEIESQAPRLSIDQSQCFAAVNRRTPTEFSLYMREQARQRTLEAIAHIAQVGDMLGAIEIGMSIADLTVQESIAETGQLAMVSIPRPSIQFATYPVRIHYTPGKNRIQATPGRVENHFTRGQVEAYLIQQNQIAIKAEAVRHDILI